MIVTLLISFTYYGLIAPIEAGKRTVAAQEGKTVTLQPETPKLISNEQFIWTFTSTEMISKSLIVQSQVFKGEVHTDYKGKFKDILLLNRSTGSLTIRNITASQSGLYHLQITHENGSVKEWNFNCTVYAPVSAPDISKETFQPKNLPHSRTTSRPSSSCRVLCSVRNDRDVSLYWFRADELLSQTSSPDVNTTLSLRLDLDTQDNSTYSCVSANPVSNHTTSLDISAVCSSGNQPGSLLRRSYVYLLLTISILMTIAIVAIAIYWKRKRRTHNTCTAQELEDPHYADLKYRYTNEEKQDASHKTEQTSETIYSGVVT
ncbi:hypothetical protein ACEWY4_007228 [Coilia grayii]|uniref:Ig-like domain-containing protein n=1 Tax=Coilia grayii TaxID=363190 RepID=A0ABD1KFP5_9TELE